MEKAYKANGPVNELFDATADGGRIKRDALVQMEKEGLITISRKATGMITYELTDEGRQITEHT